MKRHIALSATALLAAALLSGGAALAATTATVPAPIAAPLSDTPPTSTSLSTSMTDTAVDTGWKLTSRTADSQPVEAFQPLVTAPTADEQLHVAIDPSEQEQYWFWAYGVQVVAEGLAPGEEATISVTLSSGVERSWTPSVADSDGKIDRRVAYIDLDPDNTHPAVGPAQIKVTAASGAVGTAVLNIVSNAGEVLRASTNPTSISQDRFLDEPVTITVTGFAPWDKVFFNMGLPDSTIGAVGTTEGLHADENGVFTYEIQATSVNSQVGRWTLSFLSGNQSRNGATTLEVTPGAPREADKTMRLPASISLADFSAQGGAPFDLSGFLPFDTYELTLFTPRGGLIPLGLARTNGEGTHTNSVMGPTTAPLGTYTVRAQSTTTGSYAEARMSVEGEGGPREPQVALTPTTLTASALADSSQGTVLSGSELVPGTTLRISLRDSSGRRIALTVGPDAYATVGEDGTFSVLLVALQAPSAGEYTVWASSGGGPLAYDLRLPLTVTETEPNEPGGTTPPTSGPSDTTRSETFAPPSAVPTPAAPRPEVVPEEDKPVIPSEQDGFEMPAPTTPAL